MKFDYYQAENVGDAIQQLEKVGEKGKIIAGGTDLLIGINNKRYSPQVLVDITSIPGLDTTETCKGKGMKIGANVTHGAICQIPDIEQEYIALVEACSQLGSPQVRNLATIGGNICNAAPSAETAPALIALGCMVIISGPLGTRELKVEELFEGPSKNALKPFEIVTHLELGKMPANSGNAYFRLSPRNALDIAIVNVGAFVELNDNQQIEDVRICLGSVAPTPIRAFSAEKMLIGEIFSEDLVKEAGQLAKNHASPISDIRGSASYRKVMVAALTERVLQSAYERAQKGQGRMQV